MFQSVTHSRFFHPIEKQRVQSNRSRRRSRSTRTQASVRIAIETRKRRNTTPLIYPRRCDIISSWVHKKSPKDNKRCTGARRNSSHANHSENKHCSCEKEIDRTKRDRRHYPSWEDLSLQKREQVQSKNQELMRYPHRKEANRDIGSMTVADGKVRANTVKTPDSRLSIF